MDGSEHGREDLLGLGTVRAAVAAADFAHDHGRANRVLGSPVGRVDGGITEEGEECRRFGGSDGPQSAGRREWPIAWW